MSQKLQISGPYHGNKPEIETIIFGSVILKMINTMKKAKAATPPVLSTCRISHHLMIECHLSDEIHPLKLCEEGQCLICQTFGYTGLSVS